MPLTRFARYALIALALLTAGATLADVLAIPRNAAVFATLGAPHEAFVGWFLAVAVVAISAACTYEFFACVRDRTRPHWLLYVAAIAANIAPVAVALYL